MHVVAIHGWQDETPALALSLAAAVGVTAYEARQRLIGGGPAVVGRFADPAQASALQERLQAGGMAAMTVDAGALRNGGDGLFVAKFVPGESSIEVEGHAGEVRAVDYGEIELLLRGTRITARTNSDFAAEREFSLSRALFTGVSRKNGKEEAAVEDDREEVLHLFAARRPPVIFAENGLHFEGMGKTMKPSREMNFLYLVTELLRLCPKAVYDDRLVRRSGQAHLLGPALAPETHFSLAVEILSRSLRQRGN